MDEKSNIESKDVGLRKLILSVVLGGVAIVVLALSYMYASAVPPEYLDLYNSGYRSGAGMRSAVARGIGNDSLGSEDADIKRERAYDDGTDEAYWFLLGFSDGRSGEKLRASR
jgi:hypothetical protein